MRLRKGMMAWVLTIAIVLGICPDIVQAASIDISTLEVGESTLIDAGSVVKIGTYYSYLRYYSSKDSQEVLWTDDEENLFKSLPYMTGEYPNNYMTFVDLHMAPKASQKWVVERIEDIRVDVPIRTIDDTGFLDYRQYNLYPADTYCASEYDLDGGQWNNNDWIDTVNGVQHGVWKSASAIPVKSSVEKYSSTWENWNYGDHGEKLWSVYDGYEVTLPSATEVTKADNELKEWQINQTIVEPGNSYSVSTTDSVYSIQLGQDKIDIKAIWAPKTIGAQQVSNIALDTATFTATYDTYYPVTDAGFRYKEASATDWMDVPVGAANGELMATVTGLNSGTEYEVQAYLENETGKIENEIASFKTYRTPSIGAATVPTATLTTASFSAPYICDAPVIQAAFEYKKATDTQWTTVTAQVNVTTETLTASISGLESNTVYQVRAVLMANSEVSRSAVVTDFRTKQQTGVGTAAVTGVTAQAATFTVDYVSEEPLVEQGFLYRAIGESGWKDLSATVSGNEFTVTTNTLLSNTTYEVRGYIGTLTDTYEGSIVSFTTPKKTQFVDLVTINDVTSTGASFITNYVSDDAITQQGFSYKKSSDSNWIQLPATATGNLFTATVRGLESNTTYEVKGYIKTIAGETETQIVRFTTLKSSSGGSGGSGSSGSSSSSSKIDNTRDTTAQQVASHILKAIEQGDTPTVVVDGSYNAQVPVEALEAIVKAGQALVVQSGSVGVTFNPPAIKALLGNDNVAPPVQVAMAPIIPTTLEQITQHLIAAEEGTILGGRELTFSLSVNTAKPQDSFVEPLDIQLDLSKLNLKDFTKLTLVRYEIQQDGSVTAVKLGGKYDEKTKSFTAKTGEPGLYGVMAVERLTQITLKIDHNELEQNDKFIQNDVAPEIINGLTMMPLRAIAESLGAEVKWDGNLKEAMLLLDGKTLVVGKEQGLMIKQKERRTLVPVRYIAENLGANVLWIPSTRQVQIVR